MYSFQQFIPRRSLRLPQLAKHNRRLRQNGPRSEFITMCENIADQEEARRSRAERLRREIEEERARQRAISGCAA